MSELFGLPLGAIFVISSILVALALEGGRLLGRRAGRVGGDNVVTLEAAVLGLLALIIGFTVSIAISRYDARREAILEEANAIGTAAIRASLLPEPHAAASLAILHDYAVLRQSLTGLVDRADELIDVVARSNDHLNRL